LHSFQQRFDQLDELNLFIFLVSFLLLSICQLVLLAIFTSSFASIFYLLTLSCLPRLYSLRINLTTRSLQGVLFGLVSEELDNLTATRFFDCDSMALAEQIDEK